MYGYNSEQFKKFKKYAWLVLLSFGFTYLFFYNGRQNINLVMDLLKEEFSSSLGTIGVVSSALFWCYAFGQLVSGRLGSLFGYKKLMIFGVASSAILNVIISFQQSLVVIAILWGLNGFCQAMVWANGVGVLDWAVYMGAAIQASIFGFVQEKFGWSAIFIAIGCLYIILLALTLIARKMKMKRL